MSGRTPDESRTTQPVPHPKSQRDVAPLIHPALRQALHALDGLGAPWALMRGADDLARPLGDVDLLIAVRSVVALGVALNTAGFYRLTAAGRGTHHFYLRYDPVEDLWLKLDIVTQIAFGEYQEFETNLAQPCLRRRRRIGPLGRLEVSDEAWLLLLHLLLDKGEVPPDRHNLAVSAAWLANPDGAIPELVNRVTGEPEIGRDLLRLIREQSFDMARNFALGMRKTWERRHPLRVGARRLAGRVARRASGLTVGSRGPGRIVAVLGPDGAGKTTLAQGVALSSPLPVRYVYSGFWRESRWDTVLCYLPGARLTRLVFRAARVCLAARYHRLRGRLVLADRFNHDVLASVDTSLGGRIFAFVALNILPQHDLAILLDAPGPVMFARKQEHSPEVLETRRQEYLKLSAEFPDTVVLDATESADVVRRRATDAIWKCCANPPADTEPGPRRKLRVVHE